MAVNLSFIGGAGWQFFTDDGVPLSGGKIFTYAAGTTTPQTTYTSRDGTIPNTNPIILDAAGRTPQQIWSTEGLLYKYVVKDANNVLIRSWDNIGGSLVASDLEQSLALPTGATKIGFTGFKGQIGTVADLADADGADWIGFTPNGAGAIARSVQERLRDYISPQDFGAVGDGVTDDTVAIQAAIDALPDNVVLDGNNALYCVTTLNLKSNVTMQNFRFITKAGSTNLISPITIGAYDNTATISNVLLFNIHIDGNRANQTGISGPEDGGRCGFRIIGHTYNVAIINCSANYCATDGLEVFRGSNTGTTWPFTEHLLVSNCIFNWNRRCGISINGTRYATFENIECCDNGLDLPGALGVPTNNGNFGARVGSSLYGWGFDAETYADNTNPGSWIRDQFEHLVLNNYKGLRNAGRGFLLNEQKYQDAAGYIPSRFIRLKDCWVDGGAVGPEPYAIAFSPTQAVNRARGAIASDITIENCRASSGFGLLLRSVEDVFVSGGVYNTTNLDGTDRPYLGNAEYAFNVNVVGVNSDGKNLARELPATINYIGQKRVEIPAGEIFNLGVSRSAGAIGLLTLLSSAPDSTAAAPTGGHFAANAYIYSSTQANITTLYRAGAVTIGPDTDPSPGVLHIINNQFWWELKNTGSTTMYLIYDFQF